MVPADVSDSLAEAVEDNYECHNVAVTDVTDKAGQLVIFTTVTFSISEHLSNIQLSVRL